MAHIDYQNDLFCRINDSYFRIEGESVEETINIFFKIDDSFILFDLKELCCRFGLEWNFVSSRNGNSKSCNRASRKIYYVSTSIRNLSSITFDCN